MKKLYVGLLLVVLFPIVAKGQHIHVLMVSDTADETIGKACGTTIRRVGEAFNYLVPPDRYSITIMESGKTQYDSSTVLAAIRAAVVAKGDTFVFLYDGHGARAQGHHFLHMPNGGRLWSADVQDAVRRKPCDLRLILTGSCNVPIERGPRAAAPAEAWNVEQQGIAPVMEELFINHRGLLHMNGAWPGQFGFTSQASGAWFFDELLTYCTLAPTARPTWWCIDRMMDRRLAQRFRQEWNGKFVEPGTGYTQTTLHPITWSYPENTNLQKPRFGVVGDDDFTQTGVTVTSVAKNGPGENITIVDNGQQRHGSLQNGDVILSIFGQEVDDADSFFELVRLSRRVMYFTFERNGNTHNAEATLRW